MTWAVGKKALQPDLLYFDSKSSKRSSAAMALFTT